MNLNPNHLHHAYLSVGSIIVSVAELRKFFDTSIQNMQWIENKFEKFGIDEVRDLRTLFNERTNGKFVIITAERFPHEAQNAFLKFIEEPTSDMHIFLFVPHSVEILPTVQSRVMKLSNNSVSKETLFPMKEFLFSSVSDRLSAIETLIKSRDESLQPHEVRTFLDALEITLANFFHKKRLPRYAEWFEALRDARGWAGKTGFPMKNIVEYVAMVLPDFSVK